MSKHLETAIRDAVEKGGYDFGGSFKEEVLVSPSFSLNASSDIVISSIVFGFGGDPARSYETIPLSKVLLDPVFWQALGKARGWNPSPLAGMEGYSSANLVPVWHSNWLVFIDHLAAGGDIESFFTNLT